MQLGENTKKLLLAAAALILGIAVGIWLILGAPEHIEDTNGPADFSLQVITEENIINRDFGSVGGPKKSTGLLTGDAVEFSAEKFTGVYEILYDHFLLPSDFDLSIANYEIRGGNFQLLVVHNDRIVAVLEPDLFVEYRLEDVTGTVSLRIAGESAAFSFAMSGYEYDRHSHE